MHNKFRLIRAQRNFAELLKLSQEQQKQLVENPAPFLERAYAELSEARRLIAEITAAASGTDELLEWRGCWHTPPLESIELRLAKRLGKVKALLHKKPA